MFFFKLLYFLYIYQKVHTVCSINKETILFKITEQVTPSIRSIVENLRKVQVSPFKLTRLHANRLTDY